jgi:putative hydroxymethylpyrimidine transport system substrate-binding protein
VVGTRCAALRRDHGRRPTTVALAAVIIAALAVLAGCGEREETSEGSDPERFDLALDWFPNPDHAGIYEALERGHFAQAGLEVEPQIPSDPSAPIKQVAAGRVDLAISYEPEVLIAREQGLDVVAVGALAGEPLTALVSLGGDAVRNGRRLDGARVATAGIPYQAAFLRAILAQANLNEDDVERIDVGLNLLSPLISGKVDAALGPFWNIEGVELAKRDEDPTVVPVDELGIPTYNELVLVASGEQVDEDPEAIRLFLAALERGTRDAAQDPASATAALLRANDDLEPKLTRAQVARTLPVLLRRKKKETYGFMDPKLWREFAGFMVDEELLETLPATDDVLTNDLLPGKIPE